MRAQILVAVCLAGALASFAQDTSAPQPGQMKDPRAILAAAAPYYEFNDPALKPWHLKAAYQLYDDKGNPGEQGTFEYWWVSPKVYRNTWARPGATHTDWHTADGKHAYQATGDGLNYFENKLNTVLISPLPDASDLDPAKNRLDKEDLKLSDVKLPCVMVIPVMPQHGQVQTVPLGLFPTYCFDPNLPALRASYSFGTVAMEFNHIVKVQGRLLAKEILLFEGGRKLLTAEVETIEGISASDPALTPDPAATYFPELEKVGIGAGIAVGMLMKKVVPIYPQDAKDARVDGRVVLQAIIGTDGRIHDLRVQEAPWPSLAASALWSVSQWQYKPYLLNGQPVEVETTVNVIFKLGG
jgi:TonB family protein